MRVKYFIFSLAFLVSWTAATCSAQEFKIEQGWSQVEFGVKNLGVHNVNGRFKTFSGTINFDETNVAQSSVTVSIQIASIDTGIKKRDAHLQKTDFFDAAQYPEMTFQSERIEMKGVDNVLVGLLTIKGKTKEVELPFTYSTEKSQQGSLILHAEAHGVINRHDFGINYGSNFSVGKWVRILIHIQAVP